MGKPGLLLMLGKGSASKKEEPDDMSEFDGDLEGLGRPSDEGGGLDDEPSAEFSAFAETALGSSDPERISALRELIRLTLQEG
jgi:hypothetical protein